METHPIPSAATLSNATKEIIVGAAGGQPFDIVKVRMQTQNDRHALQVARNIWVREGSLAFYKGSLSPLIGVGTCIGIVYSSFDIYSRALRSLNPQGHDLLSLKQMYLAGGLAGLTNSLISGPMEHIRIRLQVQSPNSPYQRYTGVYDCLRTILQRAGPLGIYRGQTATMAREFHSYGIWFSLYEFLMRQMIRGGESGREQLARWKVASCGALTGTVLWALNYPFDVIKSKMQADGFGHERQFLTTWDAVRHTWCISGWRGFVRGLGPTLLRAGPVSASTFVVVEEVRKHL
ncbi:hypothetical protein FE257_005751 [Aspergillus nanangensis]|uniref:Mitochondrial thiamine pyrophosphate carrier 1 n=1 Tax=Aspergillus nanangensis TaxID=2582783 RepID=A0AAD4GVF6_ASPNN|nr:hypothetical protein FE257_005751 [Aspergillus nanangensis]